MNFFAFSGLINALAATFLGIVVYVRDRPFPPQQNLRPLLSEYRRVEFFLLRMASC